MNYNYRITIIATVVVAGAIYGVFAMPPLTTSGASGVPDGVSQAAYDQAVAEEYAFCRANNFAAECACFAYKSGVILTTQNPRIQGFLYADTQELARGQAGRDC